MNYTSTEDVVRRQLRNSETAIFSDESVYKDIVCGNVKVKNYFGGYTNEARFVVVQDGSEQRIAVGNYLEIMGYEVPYHGKRFSISSLDISCRYRSDLVFQDQPATITQPELPDTKTPKVAVPVTVIPVKTPELPKLETPTTPTGVNYGHIYKSTEPPISPALTDEEKTEKPTPCVYKRVMTDEDYRACDANPPH